MLALCSLLILVSCDQEDNSQVAQDERKEMVKVDPLFTSYLKAMETQSRFTSESQTLDLKEFSKIMKSKNNASHSCDIDKQIFGGDADMEHLADLFCITSKASDAFRDKYPFISDMTKEELGDFFKGFDLSYSRDVEARKAKAMKLHEEAKKKELNNNND